MLFRSCLRVDRTRLNKRTVEALIKAGAFDSLHLNRAALVASIDKAFEFANTSAANANQGGLFDMLGDDSHGSSTQEPELEDALPWGIKERLTQEKTAIGFYLSGQIGLDPATGQLVEGIEPQIHRVFANLAAVAAAAGLNLDRAVRMTVYLTDLGHFAKVNEIMAQYVGQPYPSRAAVGVASLPRGALVEVDCILHAG